MRATVTVTVRVGGAVSAGIDPSGLEKNRSQGVQTLMSSKTYDILRRTTLIRLNQIRDCIGSCRTVTLLYGAAGVRRRLRVIPHNSHARLWK